MTFQQFFKLLTRPLLAVSLVIFILISFIYLDRPVAIYFHNLHLGERWVWLNGLSLFGEGIIYICLFFLLALFFRYIKHNQTYERQLWFLWFCVFVPMSFCLVAKILLGRARPELLLLDQSYGFYGLHFSSKYWSFPSGHTTTVMSLVFGLCFLFPRLNLLFILGGIVMVFSRVVLAKHYLSDIMLTSYLVLLTQGVLVKYTSPVLLQFESRKKQLAE